MKKIKIGIPRTNNYYKYGVFWKHFFLSLGCKIILSPGTNNKIINRGENNQSLNNCFQNKLYYGHIDTLINKCDYILIYETCSYVPQCINYKMLLESMQHKLALSQILYFNPNKIEILEIIKLALKITKNPIKIIYSYINGKIKQKNCNINLENYQKNKLNNKNKKVLIVGNLNNIEDKYMSIKILNELSKNNIEPIFSNNLSPKEALFFSKQSPINIKNKEIKKIIGAVYYYRYTTKGIIYMSTGNCMLDQYLYEIIKRTTKAQTIIIIDLNNHYQAETKIELLIDKVSVDN